MERWTNWVFVQSSLLLFGSFLPSYSCESSFQFSSKSLCISSGLGPILTSAPKDNSKSTTRLLCTTCLKCIIVMDLHSDLVRKGLEHSFCRWGIWGSKKVDNFFKIIQLGHGVLKFKHRCTGVQCLFSFLYLFQGLRGWKRNSLCQRNSFAQKALTICFAVLISIAWSVHRGL